MPIYKILVPAEWEAFESEGVFAGSSLDLRSGFVHCSSLAQVAATAQRFFSDQPALVVVGLDADRLGDMVRWEAAHEGETFPHVYGALPMSAVVSVHRARGAGPDMRVLSLAEAHEHSQVIFAGIVAGLDDAQLQLPTPCEEWSVADVIAHVVAGNRRTAGLAEAPLPAGLEAVGRDLAESAAAAQAALDAPGFSERVVQTRVGTVGGELLVFMRTTDVFVHSWDLASATGISTDLAPELAGWLLELCRDRVKPGLRGPGRPFAEEQACPQFGAAADRLAAFLGRRAG